MKAALWAEIRRLERYTSPAAASWVTHTRGADTKGELGPSVSRPR